MGSKDASMVDDSKDGERVSIDVLMETGGGWWPGSKCNDYRAKVMVWPGSPPRQWEKVTPPLTINTAN